MGITKFDERRTLTWGDFRMELTPITKKLHLEPCERKYIRQRIEKGEEIQLQLNEDWLEEGFMPYEQYMKCIRRYISMQNDIVNDIKGYLKNVVQFRLENTPTNKAMVPFYTKKLLQDVTKDLQELDSSICLV